MYLIDTNLQLNYVLKVDVFLEARNPKRLNSLVCIPNGTPIITSNSHRIAVVIIIKKPIERDRALDNHLEANGTQRAISTEAIRIGIYSRRSLKAF